MLKYEKKAHMVNQTIRIGALNCFEVLTSINWHLNVVIALLASPQVQRKTLWPMRLFK